MAGLDEGHRFQIERELRLIRAAFDSTADAIKVGDLKGRSIYHNRAFEELFGYTAEQLVHAGGPEALFSDPNVASAMLDSIGKGRAWAGEVILRSKTGRLVTASLHADQIKDETGKPVGLIGVFTDITELKRAQDFRKNILDCVTDGIGTLDLGGYLTLVNRRTCEITGYEPGEMVGRHYSFLLSADELARAQTLVERVLSEGTPVWSEEIEIIRKDSSRRLVRISMAPLKENQRITGLVGTAEDVTELKRLQEDKIQSEKLAFLGHMIAGAAHKLRDPHKAIMGYADWLREHISDRDARFKIDVIIEETARAEEIAADLLAFAHRESLNWEALRVNDLIERMLQQRSASLSAAGITVTTDLKPTPVIWGDVRWLERVFNNIISNAEEAMAAKSGERTLMISTEAKGADPQRATIRISDSGHGIPVEVMPRVFDPFFTTKRSGQHKGLGLSVSYGIIKLHGGEIYIESRPGFGTSFTIEIPARDAPPKA